MGLLLCHQFLQLVLGGVHHGTVSPLQSQFDHILHHRGALGRFGGDVVEDIDQASAIEMELDELGIARTGCVRRHAVTPNLIVIGVVVGPDKLSSVSLWDRFDVSRNG